MGGSISFIQMYDDMFSHLNEFKRDNYEEIFKAFMKEYGDHIRKVVEAGEAIEDSSEKEVYYAAFAKQLSSHVKELVYAYPERKREKVSVDHNVTMVAYFLPCITYYKYPEYERFGEIFVEVWNKEKTTSNTLQLSTYDNIAGGFKKSIFCYITTAVCETLNKPDDCYELTTLRTYRDSYLANTEGGRKLIEEYYRIAPRMVLTIDCMNNHEQIYTDIYSDYILPCIRDIENQEYESCKTTYANMVRSLEAEYILN